MRLIDRPLRWCSVVLLSAIGGYAMTATVAAGASNGTHGHCVRSVAHTHPVSTDPDAHGDTVARAAHDCGHHHHGAGTLSATTTNRDAHGDAVSQEAHTAAHSSGDTHGDSVSAVSQVANDNGVDHRDTKPASHSH